MFDIIRNNGNNRIIDISNGYKWEDLKEGVRYIKIHKRDALIRKVSLYFLTLLDNSISYISFITFKGIWFIGIEVYNRVKEYRIKRSYGWLSKFDKKFDKENLFLLALQCPESLNSYSDLRLFYNFLGDRQLREVLEIKKNKIKFYKEIWKK
ncbi:MAG: hypothetical protein ACD_4C00488G0001 [uncultured bacterium (gcode 4)]|uniref:Uncharacterized protein n=1 Tax=uncultured bacterium (gcode 4) TaxID=1234023 RepID=K2FSR4_9BACT|nr:MAG: hypothetical protein ACD_4C00488G0001 [uncultured bacterium (gcode 4)]